MVARREGDGYRYDVHLQGERATAFFQHSIREPRRPIR